MTNADRTTPDEVRVGRNYLRLGDDVRVLPSKPGKRDGFVGRVRRLVVAGGDLVEVEVVGPHGFRTLRPHRVKRVAQTRDGERIERRR